MPSTTEPLHGATAAPAPASIPNLRNQLPKLEPRRRAPPTENPIPVPETPALPPPPDLSHHVFFPPTKRILSARDHELFLASDTYQLLLSFVFSLADAVVDTPVSAVARTPHSPIVTKLLDVLDRVEDVVRRCPPEDQGDSRFGNKGFRVFLDTLGAEQHAWQTAVGVPAAAVPEVATYFAQAFGNRTRIDYGSGHELNFAVWLLCLYQLGLVTRADFPAVTLVVFARYITLMRHIQTAYYLEPAGSHGVWGLDDYQFLPFLFGAAQLLHHAYIRPRSIHQSLTLEEYGGEFLYLGQVNFVNSIKNVEGLRWHSPMLDDISAAKSWRKVDAGMRRMFVAEVLGKLPVMQHFLFGSLVPADPRMSQPPPDDGDARRAEEPAAHGKVVVELNGRQHLHDLNAWGDCCGIKVPSSIAAAQEQKKRMGAADALRRIPFD